ncbi:cytochrome c1 [Rubellimicrobium sp. CFH 75288]|uniref:cytochrome c1 n=1 Tax=Rubellimicrobium sp. CFH 75288 TaxID=2697034 RepID=UPI001412F462|nr:cytochrome c1 [Rubellimicrobium sp. CFH 75288]NAZ35636.1 cytochrome c1 [Rubellimicrobium sp. CFH 75288]
MLKTLALGAALGTSLVLAAPAVQAAGEGVVTDYAFPFEGPFGAYDPIQLQRGLKVFTEACIACHGLSFVAYRNLSEPGGPMLPVEQMRAYAEQFTVFDPTLDDGFGAERPATPADRFPQSGLANAPDLSLMAKARAGFHGPYGTGLNQLFRGMGGPEYIASVLTGYRDPPDCAPDNIEGYYNIAFSAGNYPVECTDEHGHHLYPGSWINMPPPIADGQVDFDDGAPNDLTSMAVDTAAFLMWAAEPKLNQRKQAGVTGIIALVVLSVLLYLTNKRVWAPVKAGGRPLGRDQIGGDPTLRDRA